MPPILRNGSFLFVLLIQPFYQARSVTYSPAAEEGNLALLDKVFFFTDYFSLGYVQYNQVGAEFPPLGN